VAVLPILSCMLASSICKGAGKNLNLGCYKVGSSTMSAMSVESPFVISPPTAMTTEWFLRAHQDSALVDRVSKEFGKAYASFSTVAEEHTVQTKKLQEILDTTLAENKRLAAQNTKLVEMCEKSTGQAVEYKKMLAEQKGLYEKELAKQKGLYEKELANCRDVIVSHADMLDKLEKGMAEKVHTILTEKEAELAACKQQMEKFIAVATQKQEAFLVDAEEQLKLTKCAVQAAAEARNEHLRAENAGLVAEVARLKGCLAALARPPAAPGTRHEL
jgi:hypothetical protein